MIETATTTQIPEELYNLTQLAEVTLAAGRLSTTNVNEIREYINKEKNKETNELPNNEQHEENRKFNKCRKKFTIENNCWMSTNNLEDFSYNNNLKTEFEQHSVIKKAHSICGELQNNNNNNDQNINNNNNNNRNQSAVNQMHLLSSSDDDTNYYSHKIFDRKKSRRSTISENYRYDEQLSCSSILSSSDEQHLHFRHSSKGLDVKPSSEIISSSLGEDDHHICPECGKKYSTSSNLARHRQTHRSILDKKARRCPHCEKVYVSMPAYSMHVRTHSQGCECPHCGKCFSRPWLLQGHIRTHTGEKPFKCNICTKAFADKSNLRAHIQTHSNTKPHSCSRCGKSFALKSYLYKHEESSCMRNHLKQDKNYKNQKSDITRSSLASKLLQKDNNNGNKSPNNFDMTPLTSNNNSWKNSPETIVEQNIVTEDKTQKSYTTLTSPMSQDDYDRFTRISVIRPPITNTSFDSNGGGLQMNFYQENPVDFSPKNNFTHSTKTSPFELTSSYAIVV